MSPPSGKDVFLIVSKARYGLSNDTLLSECGLQSHIPYASDYQAYKKILDVGQDTLHVQSIFKQWNRALFPASAVTQPLPPDPPAISSTAAADQMLQSFYDVDEDQPDGVDSVEQEDDEPCKSKSFCKLGNSDLTQQSQRLHPAHACDE